MSRKTAFQAMDISLNTFIIFAEIYYVLSKLMLCFYVLKNKAILYLVSCRFCLDMGNKFRKSPILSCDNSFNGLICDTRMYYNKLCIE